MPYIQIFLLSVPNIFVVSIIYPPCYTLLLKEKRVFYFDLYPSERTSVHTSSDVSGNIPAGCRPAVMFRNLWWWGWSRSLMRAKEDMSSWVSYKRFLRIFVHIIYLNPVTDPWVKGQRSEGV
ncbi:hypothetical protein CHS0354_005363 [Potamilus streckersoni]|uniref:Uncharacterized protein n=1 Tax=Potamilus streckersoni TaxID=2493646 RepID=A0AAE0VWY4_9BIVA|nr:hypothetical protein CHS0354_005363 [Potamilus streckersoni]